MWLMYAWAGKQQHAQNLGQCWARASEKQSASEQWNWQYHLRIMSYDNHQTGCAFIIIILIIMTMSVLLFLTSRVTCKALNKYTHMTNTRQGTPTEITRAAITNQNTTILYTSTLQRSLSVTNVRWKSVLSFIKSCHQARSEVLMLDLESNKDCNSNLNTKCPRSLLL